MEVVEGHEKETLVAWQASKTALFGMKAPLRHSVFILELHAASVSLSLVTYPPPPPAAAPAPVPCVC